MLVNLYRLKTPGAIFSLPVVTGLLAINIFFKEKESIRYILDWQTAAFDFFEEESFFNYVFTVLIVSLIAHQLNNLINRHSFYSKDTFLPGLIYVLFIASGDYLYFSPFLIAHLFVVFGLMQIFKLRRQEEAKAIIFMGTFYFGVAAIFSPPLLILLIFPWIALAVFRPFVWREWVMVIPGIILPALYHLAFYYLWTDSLDIDVADISQQLKFPSLNIVQIGLYSWIALIIVSSLFGIIGVMRSQVVRFKKQSQLVLHLFWITIIVWLISLFIWDIREITLVIPLAMIVAIYQLHTRNQLVVNMTVLVWFIITVVNLWYGVFQ